MFRPALVFAVLTAMATPMAAIAGEDFPTFGHPPVGADTAYDYVKHNHYVNYDGQPAPDPRALEQNGYRDGHLPIASRTGYYAGVRTYPIYSGYSRYGYGYGYGYGGYGYDCGCRSYARRYTEYYDDYGRRGDAYSYGYDRYSRY